MTDNKRQEDISNPRMMFEKLRNKASKMAPVRNEGERKRESLKPVIPKVDDEDIIELCKRYPVKPNEDKKKEENNEDKMKRGAELRMHKLQMDAKRR